MKRRSDPREEMDLDLLSVDNMNPYDDANTMSMMEINKDYGQECKQNRGGYFLSMKWVGHCLANCSLLFPQCCNCNKIIVEQGYVGLLIEGGRFVAKLRAGMHIVNPLIQKIVMVDMRDQVMELHHQNVLSKDGVTFDIDAMVNYRIIQPEYAFFAAKQAEDIISNIVSGTLKQVISANSFGHILEERESVNNQLYSLASAKVERLGVRLINVETLSLHISESLELTFAQVIEADTFSQARVVEARSDLEIAKIMVEAAEVMAENPVSLQIACWENLRDISAHNTTTLVVPADMLSRGRLPEAREPDLANLELLSDEED
jgi:hypothetical protein